MKEASFTNKVYSHKKEIYGEELSEERKRQTAVLLADRFMEAAGFRRKIIGKEREDE